MSKGVGTRKTLSVEPREIADLSFDDDAFPLPPLPLKTPEEVAEKPAKIEVATKLTALPIDTKVNDATKTVNTTEISNKSEITVSDGKNAGILTEKSVKPEVKTKPNTLPKPLKTSDCQNPAKSEALVSTALPTEPSSPSTRPMASPVASTHACGALFAQCASRPSPEAERSCTKIAEEETCALAFEQPVSLAQILVGRAPVKGDADDGQVGAFHKHGAELNTLCQLKNSSGPAEPMGNGASAKSGKVSQSPPPAAVAAAAADADKVPEEFELLRTLLPKLRQEAKEAEEKASFWETHALGLRAQLKAKEAEVGKLQREVHKLKSVLRQATSFGDAGLTTSPTPPAALKKQGVSGESSDVSQLADDILVQHHDKDFRSKQLIKDSLMDNDFLKNLDSGQVRELVDAMYPARFERGSYVITEGEPGQHLYVAAEGEFEVMKEDKVLGRMGPGKAFGELAILYNCTRTASIRAVDHAKAWVLDRRVFQQIMMRTGLQRLEDNVNFLRSVPLLADLSHDLLAKVADVLEVEFYPAGAYIIRQGAHGATFFIISGGCVKVTQRVPGRRDQEEEIRTLQRGDYFGEQALLNEECRTANIVALPPGVECLTLDRDSFRQLIGDLQELQGKDYGDTTRVLSRPSSSFSINAELADMEFDEYRLSELTVVATLGVGGFGRVELVQSTRDKTKTFALKCLKKKHIVDTQQQEHVFSEKAIMFGCRSPFICRLYRTFKDSKYVYMLLEACLGGEVWTILRDKGHFDDQTTRFVAGCVVEAFSYLHARGIVYRDLKPENLLLDATGYVKLVDFGFSKRLGHSAKTWTFCGTPEYVAPEIILNKGHDRAVDYWSLGVLMHELLTGTPPFVAADPMKTYNVILKGIDMVDFPRHVTRNAQSLIKRLCRDAPSERLGCQRGGLDDLRKHKWFQGFDWDGLRQRTMPVPISPQVKGPTDTGNFDAYPKDLEPTPDESSNWDAEF